MALPSDSDPRYWKAAESAAVVGASPPGVAAPSAPTIGIAEAPLGAIATAGLRFVPHASSVPKNISPQFTEPPEGALQGKQATAAIDGSGFIDTPAYSRAIRPRTPRWMAMDGAASEAAIAT